MSENEKKWTLVLSRNGKSVPMITSGNRKILDDLKVVLDKKKKDYTVTVREEKLH